jgi:Fe-S-cluster containining protein
MKFRECGDCTACCDGWLIGNSYGNRFGEGKSCPFLVKKVCTIYKDRPRSCHDYQCAWTQNLFPDWMKPNECGVMISVETGPEKQFLRVVEMHEVIDYAVYQEIEKFCKENNTHYVKVPYESRNTQL